VKPFICRFAVGRDGLAYSSDWRIWTHRNKPDLYIAIRQLGGELKASVHAPHPPHHTGWRRHLGFQKDATSIVSKQAKQDGGPHKVQWPGCEIGPDTTVEYRIIIRGMSLEETIPIPFAAAQEIWTCTWPGFSQDRSPVIQRYRQQGELLVVDHETWREEYRILENNQFGLVATRSIGSTPARELVAI
jgi:hypothetical protein